MSIQSRENLRQVIEERFGEIISEYEVTVYDDNNRSTRDFIDDGFSHIVRNGFRICSDIGQEHTEQFIRREHIRLCGVVSENWERIMS